MFSRLQELLHWRLSLLMSGRHQDLAQEYVYPFPLYMAGHQHVLRTPDEMVEMLGRLQALTDGMGVTRIEPRLCAVELPREGRFRIWVSHRNFDAIGRATGGGDYVHYCRHTEAGIKTEMSDYPTCRAELLIAERQRVFA